MRAGLRRVVYDIVEPGSKPYGLAIAFDRLSIVVILASIACAVLATEPSIGPDQKIESKPTIGTRQTF